MIRVELLVDLIDDVVVSERNATEGAHRSLDHVPGSALLGLAATALYPLLDRAEAFLLFHSGRVRFGNATAVGPNQRAAYPVPMSWHARKNDAPRPGARLDPARIAHVSLGGALMDEGIRAPMKQLRDFFICEDGWVVSPRKTRVVKTAIDAATGRAADAQLFGYEALAAGQRFRASIEADDDVPDHLFERVVEALVGDRFLGRSRSAEFGRVRIERAAESEDAPVEDAGVEAGLWLVADLHAVDALGRSTPCPTAEDLGFPGATIDWSRSFVRLRRFSPWNAYRGGYDVERVVLEQGSVLWLRGLAPGTRSGQQVIGASRECGFGRCWLAPPLLGSVNPLLTETPEAPRERVAPPVLSSPLVGWLQRQANRRAGGKDAADEADRFATDVASWYAQARLDLGRGEDQPVGPSASQWRDVANVIARLEIGSSVEQALFTGDDAPCRDKRPGWSDKFWRHGNMASFAEAFKSLVAGDPFGMKASDGLILIARRAAGLAGGRIASRTRSSAGGSA
ncbi:MAG TPA: hypothetical protein PKZ76_13600 [Xanthomonadaceae bacterium]|nr:hypothetical protein [Xanthomonadaceae bacterium]